jgi:hypothetical protein
MVVNDYAGCLEERVIVDHHRRNAARSKLAHADNDRLAAKTAQRLKT